MKVQLGTGKCRKPGGKRAFTLIELLVVIAIIGILAALLLTAMPAAIRAAQVKKARIQIAQLENAITHYNAAYSRYPTAQTSGTGDFTYGGGALDNILGPGPWNANNSEVIAILMDIEKYPNGPNTVNFGHVKNTQQTKFLNATMVSGTASPGVGSDLVYRDPWGNPYIISMDLNYDGKCQDAFYQLDAVSQQSGAQGYNGLISSNGVPNTFQYTGGVMVWSLGPDKNADKTNKAITGLNKDNILSWGQ